MAGKSHGYSNEIQEVVTKDSDGQALSTYFRVYSLAFRIPRRGEIYYSPVTESLRIMKEKNYSRRAKKRHIIWSPFRDCRTE